MTSIKLYKNSSYFIRKCFGDFKVYNFCHCDLAHTSGTVVGPVDYSNIINNIQSVKLNITRLEYQLTGSTPELVVEDW